jgi:hypothetical protein
VRLGAQGGEVPPPGGGAKMGEIGWGWSDLDAFKVKFTQFFEISFFFTTPIQQTINKAEYIWCYYLFSVDGLIKGMVFLSMV